MRLLREKNVEVVEERFTRDEIYIADEAFFTGTAAEITPIRSLDDRTVGTGKPGALTQQLQKDYFAVIRGERRDLESWLSFV
jgi:branched-chain amino acid aminotransferase